MDLKAILQSIEQEDENEQFHVRDMAQSLNELGDSSDHQDVDMAQAGPINNNDNGLYSSFGSMTLRHRAPNQSANPVPEPKDIEMIDAPGNLDGLEELRGSEEPKETEETETSNDTQPQEHESESAAKSYLFNPTALGAKMASDQHQALVPYENKNGERIEHENENEHQKIGNKPASEPLASESQASNGLPPLSASPAPYYQMPIPTPSWIATHNNTPYIISTYLQLAFNIAIAWIVLYAISSGLLTFWRDVDRKLELYSSLQLTDIQRCTRKYLENDCRPDIRPPALDQQCEQWERCMDQDSSAIGRSRVTAETIAEIINSFIEPFSYKTIFVSTALLALVLFGLNFAFGFWRAKMYYKPHAARPELEQYPATSLSLSSE